MLVISTSTIGANFTQVENGEIIKGYYQYLSYYTGKWEISTYTIFDKYKCPHDKIYRKPVNWKGYMIIAPSYFKKLFYTIIYNIKNKLGLNTK